MNSKLADPNSTTSKLYTASNSLSGSSGFDSHKNRVKSDHPYEVAHVRKLSHCLWSNQTCGHENESELSKGHLSTLDNHLDLDI